MGVLGAQAGLTRQEVDGVTTFVLPAPVTPTAVLTVRVGQADETLARRGWTHLVEHLALHGRERSDLDVNGSVGLLETTFVARGDADEVVRFLAELTTWLSAPALVGIDRERDILRAESLRRGPGSVENHLDLRYGPNGPGLVAYRELGLESATARHLTDWSAEVFGYANSAFALSFEPTGLRLHLPAGARRPLPTLPHHIVPARAWTRDRSEHLTVSGLTGSSTLSPLTEQVLALSMSERLRQGEGLSYATQTSVERVSRDRLHLCAQADVLPERRGEAAELVCELIARLATHGPAPEVLERARGRLLRQLDDDPFRLWQVTSAARLHLRGEVAPSYEEARAAVRDATPEYLAREYELFSSTLLITVPADVTVPALTWTDGLPRVDVVVSGPALPHDDPGVDDRLACDDHAVERRGPHGRVVLRVDDAAALLSYPDGTRQVVGKAGHTLLVDPREWRHGDAAVARLDRAVPAEVHVAMPAREPGACYQPVRGTRRARRRLRRALSAVRTRRARTVWRVLLFTIIALRVVHALAATTHR